VSQLAEMNEYFGYDMSGDSFWENTAVFPELGVAAVPLDSALVEELYYEYPTNRLVVERERYVYTPQLLPCGEITPDPLDAMRVHASSASGHGIRVAVLDTGYADHPELTGRVVDAIDYTGLGTTDADGHGTHCIGLVCGPKNPTNTANRFGVAYNAEILNVRVLKTRVEGRDSDVIRGMLWAWRQGANIISMSLGSAVLEDEPYNFVYEIIARILLDKEVLCIAAAGNDPLGERYPVECPANSPSVMAVGAINHDFQYWDRSCISANDCQNVDVVAPGECILSTSLDDKYAYESGTSMATAYVAGIAALWAERRGSRGRKLWYDVRDSAQRPMIMGTTRDVGRGLVKAP
jgi:subtilisin family serine protease